MQSDYKNKQESPKELTEQQGFAVEQGLPETTEIAEKIEAVEIPSEKVTENVSEKRDKKGDSAAFASQKASQVKKIREELLKNPPSEKQMRREVEMALGKEIKKLQKQTNAIIYNPANRDFHKLNIVVQKLREFRRILASLAQVTYEMLKNLWLRFVHGIY